jgi:capsular polysaccharide biosynthesis protein
LREELGNSFKVEPTRFADGRPGTLADEGLSFVAIEPERRLFAVADGAVCTPAGIVYDPKTRSAIRETVESWDTPLDDHTVFSTPGFPSSVKLSGTTLVLTSLGGQTFYHFLIENLPKLALLTATAPHIDQVLVARYGETWKTRWLEAAGWKGKIVWLQDLSHFRCERLLFTNRIVRHFEPNPWAVEALQRLLPRGRPSENSPTIIWLDRQSTPTRLVTWEHELADGIAGAVRADFSTLTPAQTIHLCAGASVLVGLHGAAFANMVFCPPGAKIIELMTTAFHPWYARLAQACGHRHIGVRLDESAESRAAALTAIRDFLRSA